MTTQLGLYNSALRILGERKLASLSENREPRRLLDDVWGDGSTEGAVKYCLEMGQWTFASRVVMIDYSPSVEPPFSYLRAFDQPTDMVRVTGIYEDADCVTPLLRYADERHFWFANLDIIYASYVSNDMEYGADMGLWPETFAKLVEAYLAKEIASNLTQGDSKVALAERIWKQRKLEANSIDAMNKPTRFMPQGSWSRARHGDSARYRRSEQS
jgi:hypothetical protein